MSYPDGPDRPYGQSTYGGGPSLDAIRLVPPIFLPDRVGDLARLGREPVAYDVSTATTIGAMPASMPLVIPAMGSTPIAHQHGVALAAAAAREGVPLVLGENIAAVHGYSTPTGDGPTWKDRAMAYIQNLDLDGPGGLVIQQSVEDAMDELWWQATTDPDLQEAVQAGRIALEVKMGQGAKPGLGGATLLDDADATRLADDFHMRRMPDGRTERLSAPGTFTAEILQGQLRHLRNDFPHCPLWVKLPPGRDLVHVAQVAAEAGAAAVTIDGAEAGTALAPTDFLDHVGLPLATCLDMLRRDPPGIDVIASGGLHCAADLVKVRALGCTAGAMGRSALQAATAGEEAARLWIDGMREDVRKLVYAMGALDVADVDGACVMPAPGQPLPSSGPGS